MFPIPYEKLRQLYVKESKSALEIAHQFNCSESKVNYWIAKYKIEKRSISEAIYRRWNPKGDPFEIKNPTNIKEGVLYGLGLGLYWGEGTKRNKSSIRLGNTDPKLIKKFIEFLETIYCIKRDKLRFGLQIFSDLPKKQILNFWRRELKMSEDKFYKIITTPSKKLGTYKNKLKYGVITVYYNNKKLRDILCQTIENIDSL